MAQIQETAGTGKLNDYITKTLLCAKGCYTLRYLPKEVKSQTST